ncbi:MAG: DMT family transporter [Chloroflexota bacterium]
MSSIFYGLIAALGWGAADFIGGLASKRSSPYRVLALAEVAGFIPIFLVTLFSDEALPPISIWLWSGAASVAGMIGLVLLYRALSSGRMTVAAPVSALLAALIPIPVGALTEGLPGAWTYAGFALALAAIWLVSQESGSLRWQVNLRDLGLPLLAGFFFGLYFLLIHEASRETTLWPLVNARLTAALLMAAFGLLRRQPIFPERPLWPLVSLGGMMDVVGNIFYVLAGQTGRLDVTVVLSSLYPGTTVLLAWVFLKERINRVQAVGILLALAAIVFLTL